MHEALVAHTRAYMSMGKRPTPSPGPNEVVVDVHALALNPVDHIQHSMGFHVASYPTVLGFDVAGVVIAVGSSVTLVKTGDRVAANASAWFFKDPAYGAFQKKVLVPITHVTPLPADVSFTDAAMLPLAIYTAWTAILQLGIPRTDVYGLEDKKGILVWGVGGSVGSVAFQIAKSFGFHVYVSPTASAPLFSVPSFS